MATLVDSSVIIDLAVDDPVWASWSRSALLARRQLGLLVINPVIYAEIMAAADLDGHPPTQRHFERVDLDWESARLAGRAHAQYRRRGGAREAVLADFLIGAHAAVAGYALLTRDPRRIRAAFPGVELITPGAA